MTTETVEGAAIRFDRPQALASAAAPPLNESSLPADARRAAALRGAAIALVLIVFAVLAALLFTAATFGYSLGELL